MWRARGKKDVGQNNFSIVCTSCDTLVSQVLRTDELLGMLIESAFCTTSVKLCSSK